MKVMDTLYLFWERDPNQFQSIFYVQMDCYARSNRKNIFWGVGYNIIRICEKNRLKKVLSRTNQPAFLC